MAGAPPAPPPRPRRRRAAPRTRRGPAGLPPRHAAEPGPVPARCCSARPSRPPSHRSWPGNGAGKNGADGKQRLQAVVDETLRVPAADQAATYRRLLRAAVPPELLSDARLEELLDPANYLGQAAEISRRILAAYPEYSASVTDTVAGSHHRITDPRAERSLPWLDQQSRQYCCRPSARWATSPSSWWARPWARPRCCGPRPAPCSGTTSTSSPGTCRATASHRPRRRRSPSPNWPTPSSSWWIRSPPARDSTTPACRWAGPPACSWASSTANGSRACPCSAPERSSARPRAGWNARKPSARRERP